MSIMNVIDIILHRWFSIPEYLGERGGSVVECRTPEREVGGSKPTAAVLCPWARHFTPRKYWLITQEAVAPSRHDWKIVDWDVKPQHNQPTRISTQNVQICAYKSHSYRNNFCLLRFRTENMIVKDSFSVSMCCYGHYLLKICSERWNKVLNICICNISAICTEMTNIHDGMIGLWQLWYICKAEKTHLNDKVVLWGLCVYRTVAGKLQKIGALNLLCLKANWMY